MLSFMIKLQSFSICGKRARALPRCIVSVKVAITNYRRIVQAIICRGLHRTTLSVTALHFLRLSQQSHGRDTPFCNCWPPHFENLECQTSTAWALCRLTNFHASSKFAISQSQYTNIFLGYMPVWKSLEKALPSRLHHLQQLHVRECVQPPSRPGEEDEARSCAVTALLDGMHSNYVLQELDVSNNRLGDDVEQKISVCTLRNRMAHHHHVTNETYE